MQIQKSSRPLVVLLATVVAIITTMVVANATQTITTPNAVNITFSLAPFSTSAPITPVTSKSVLVMGCCTTAGGDQAVGQVSLLHIPSTAIVWVGLESWSGGTTTQTTAGNSATAGTHIVSMDTFHEVNIEVNSADTIRVHNARVVSEVGNVTLIW
jgi:hypothetical protein